MEITRNISSFGPGTASERTVQWWFNKFCRGDGSLGYEEHCGWPLEGGNNQLRGSPKLIFWQRHKKLPNNSALTILWKFSIWSKLERWGSSVDGCLMSWPQIKKKSSFWSVISYSMQQQWTISQSKYWSDCAMLRKVDCIWQPVTSSVIVLRSAKALLKTKLAPKKGHGQCLVVCCRSDSLQLSEFWENHYISEVCSANWDTLKTAVPTADIGQQEGPSSSPQQCLATQCTTNVSKVEQIGLWSYFSSTICTWPLDNRLLLQASQQLFAGKTLPQSAGGRKYFPRVCQILKHGFLCYRNKQIFLVGKNVSICNGSYFD